MSERNIPYRYTEHQPGGTSPGGPAPQAPQGPPRPQPGTYRQPVPPAHPRTAYLGFYFWWWLGVTALCLLASVVAFSHGAVGAGFMGLLLAGLSALYVRYLFRGGRFRMIFIVF